MLFSIEMYVDDELVGNTRLPSGAARINSMKGENGGLFIGGVGGNPDLQGKAASLDNFKGCIKNLISNGEYVYRWNLQSTCFIIVLHRLVILDKPIDFNKADVGRCDASRLYPNATETKPTSMPSFTVTVTFPDTTTLDPGYFTTTTMSTSPPGPTVVR
jgi:hypothetical protein